MGVLRVGLVATVVASLALMLPNVAAEKADAASYSNQTNVSFTSSAGVTSKYHVYASGITQPAGLLLQFHGDGAYEFKNPTSTYSLGGAKGIVAQAQSRNLITVPVLTPDASSGTTWWRKGSQNADYVKELLVDLMARYQISSDRIWLVGYSGGAEFITESFVPKYSSLIHGGGAVIIGGGSPPLGKVSSFSAKFKADFPMHWYTGANDTGWDGDGWNALEAAKSGHSWYTNSGLRTSYEWPAGVSHTLDGKFGEIVARQLDANLGAGSGATPSVTPKPTATAKPSVTPTATVKPTTTPTVAAKWVTKVEPSKTGVKVTVNIPKTAKGRTTLYVYGPNNSYWYSYTTSTGKVSLSSNKSLKAKTAYTYKVTNGSLQVGSGKFTTLR